MENSISLHIPVLTLYEVTSTHLDVGKGSSEVRKLLDGFKLESGKDRALYDLVRAVRKLEELRSATLGLTTSLCTVNRILRVVLTFLPSSLNLHEAIVLVPSLFVVVVDAGSSCPRIDDCWK